MATKMDGKRRQYERLFVHFDEDKDGNISPGELRRCIRAAGGDLSMEEAVAAVEMIDGDGDGDGLIGVDDFVAFVEAGEGEVADREQRSNELRMAFEMYDEKEEARGGGRARGRITPGSLKRMLSRLGEKRSVQECRFMVSKFDLDGDGVLDFEEFSVMMS